MKKFLSIFALYMIFTAACFARTITAVGYGNSKAAAEADALRAAVETYVGTYVGSVSITNNFNTHSDLVLTKAEGFINNYKIIEANDRKVIIEADISCEPNIQLMNDLAKKGIIKSVLKDPKIYIDLNNEIARNQIMQTLIEHGFQITNNKYLSDITISATTKFFRNGDIGKYLLDNHESTGLKSVTAEVIGRYFFEKEFGIVQSSSGVGINYPIATEKALSNAAKAFANHMADQLLEYGCGPLLLK